MSDDIFIKQDQVLGQQPYIARVPKNAQEPNIRQTQQPNNRTAQQPSTYQHRTPTTAQDPRSQQEPNIRDARQPSTYQHRSPLTYDHRSPFTYDHRSPFTYDHRSPSTYQHRSPSTYRDPRTYQNPTTYNHRSPSTYRDPVSYRNPFTYQHRSPFTYDHRSPFTYQHRSPFTYQHRSPSTYQNRQPFTYDHRSPSTYQHRSPFTYDHRSPSTYNNREPSTYNHRSPFTYNIQTPGTSQTPVIYDAIDGDSTGPTSTPQGFSAPNWNTATHAQKPEGQQAQAFANMSFDYQKSSSTIPYSTHGNTTSEQGSVHMFYNGGDNNSYTTLYFSQVSIGSNISGYPSNVTPAIDDTWAVDVKYAVTGAHGANFDGFTAAQSQGGGFTAGTYYSVYTGSSSAGSYNGTNTNRAFMWQADTGSIQGQQPRNAMCNAYGLSFTLRLSKSGQTSIFTTYTVSGYAGFGQNGIQLTASSGISLR